MKKLNVILFAILIGLGTSISSCTTKGCKDADAKNFDSGADSDDGTCMFEGKLVFYYDQAEAQILVNDGVTSLTFYIDNVLVGSSSSSVYFNQVPDCGATGAITVVKDLGSQKSKSYSYRITDQNNTDIWAGTTSFLANTCKVLKLE